MATQKYSVNQHLIKPLLSWVKSGEIAITEIQRPFVWGMRRKSSPFLRNHIISIRLYYKALISRKITLGDYANAD